jgi:hypothetical protein
MCGLPAAIDAKPGNNESGKLSIKMSISMLSLQPRRPVSAGTRMSPSGQTGVHQNLAIGVRPTAYFEALVHRSETQHKSRTVDVKYALKSGFELQRTGCSIE